MLQLSLVKVTNFVRTVPVPIHMFHKTQPKWPLEKSYTFYPWFLVTMAVPNCKLKVYINLDACVAAIRRILAYTLIGILTSIECGQFMDLSRDAAKNIEE